MPLKPNGGMWREDGRDQRSSPWLMGHPAIMHDIVGLGQGRGAYGTPLALMMRSLRWWSCHSYALISCTEGFDEDALLHCPRQGCSRTWFKFLLFYLVYVCIFMPVMFMLIYDVKTHMYINFHFRIFCLPPSMHAILICMGSACDYVWL